MLYYKKNLPAGVSMNINIYIEDTVGRELSLRAKQVGKPRNAIIREAIKEWVKTHGSTQWPRSVLNYAGTPDAVAFESHRNELTPPTEDPLE